MVYTYLYSAKFLVCVTVMQRNGSNLVALLSPSTLNLNRTQGAPHRYSILLRYFESIIIHFYWILQRVIEETT